MTKTRAQLRDLIRMECGDEVRLSGSATSGSKTTLLDTVGLLQADDYWNGRRVNIASTVDGLAPLGESRKISDFVLSTHTITLEMALSAVVDAGDTYQIAVWADPVYNALIKAAIAAYSRYRPYRTTGTIGTVNGTRYYDPPSGVDLRAGDQIEQIRYMNQATCEDYEITGWSVDRHQNKIDLGYYASDSKTLTVFYAQAHADYSSDSDTITVPEQDEEFITKWVRTQIWLFMSREAFDDFGNLVPGKWTRGNVSEDASSGRKNMKELHDTEMQEWLDQLKGGGSLITHPKSAAPGEWIPPSDYRSQ